MIQGSKGSRGKPGEDFLSLYISFLKEEVEGKNILSPFPHLVKIFMEAIELFYR